MFSHPEFDRHEQVVHAFDAPSGLKAIIAVHSTALGPAFGGCRMWPYTSAAAALGDALRLSRAMTAKCAIVGVPHGGGKAVIIGDPAVHKTPQLLRAMGRLVDGLGGRYIIADDVGTTLADLAVMRAETQHTAAATAGAMQPVPVTAHGVFSALRAAATQVFPRKGGHAASMPPFPTPTPNPSPQGGGELQGLTVAVQGLGAVGGPLCALLAGHGAHLIVADPDPLRAEEVVRRHGAISVAAEAIYAAEADIFAPCALGGVLSPATVPRLGARLVCGGANNQLATPADADALAARGIVYVPDYLVGAGGVIDFHQERIDDRPEEILAAVEVIGRITGEVLAQSARTGETPLAICDAIVQRRLGTKV